MWPSDNTFEVESKTSEPVHYQAPRNLQLLPGIVNLDTHIVVTCAYRIPELAFFRTHAGNESPRAKVLMEIRAFETLRLIGPLELSTRGPYYYKRTDEVR